MPRDEYILLEDSSQGSALDSLRSPNANSYGALVTVKGTVVKSLDTLGTGGENALSVEDININSTAAATGPNPPIINLCSEDPSLCLESTASPEKFALLYSGGATLADAKNRYWNDLAFMYLTLKSQYGYSDNNIVLIYKDGRQPKYANGTPFSSLQVDVDFAANTQGIEDAILFLQGEMAPFPNASLFVFTTNHGGGYRIASQEIKDGIFDAIMGDEVPLEPAETAAALAESAGTTAAGSTAIDETIFLYRSPEIYISDDEWASKINSLVQVNGTNKRLITVNQPCFSGGLLQDLRGPNRINISAAREGEYSYGLADGTFDDFSYHFTAALHGKYPTASGSALGYTIDPADGISILEAYWYAETYDQSAARCLIDDNNDGTGLQRPPSTPTTDGVLSSSTSL